MEQLNESKACFRFSVLGDNKLRDVSSDVVIVKLVCNEDIKATRVKIYRVPGRTFFFEGGGGQNFVQTNPWLEGLIILY